MPNAQISGVLSEESQSIISEFTQSLSDRSQESSGGKLRKNLHPTNNTTAPLIVRHTSLSTTTSRPISGLKRSSTVQTIHHQQERNNRNATTSRRTTTARTNKKWEANENEMSGCTPNKEERLKRKSHRQQPQQQEEQQRLNSCVAKTRTTGTCCSRSLESIPEMGRNYRYKNQSLSSFDDP
jgi:hypothetical protein